MTMPKVEDNEDWRTHNIFRTRVFCNGKVCNDILDGGSSENIVSKEAVEKLKLPVVEHPTPYKVAWFRKGNEVPVTSCCLVKFNMGNDLEEEAWCDVAPIDACHILLGRPWLYDKDVVHHTRANTYTLKRGTKTLILQPMKEERIAINKNSKVSRFLTGHQFEEESREIGVIYALVRKDKREEHLQECLVGKYVKSWDSVLPQAEFAYNNSMNRSIKKTPFEAAYGLKPQTVFDLVPLPQDTRVSDEGEAFAEHIRAIHEEVQVAIKASNESYAAAANQHRKVQEFKEGDMVLVHLKRERFPKGTYHKLKARKFRPCKPASESTWIAEEELKKVDPEIYDECLKVFSLDQILFLT
ncbi:hypothetical protein JRO89_XS07G0210700 [Xanthoceras sorbifolium]|uniref:Uncharacterized protein n=1 Tax=Xanthoceras sorbifolium TaxID=99658 RepID=A0ABQ8HUH7_9ROSI|nr:hypothetical protein JRO89_XS07G0210700 [Xanthoceras sorbifolium]